MGDQMDDRTVSRRSERIQGAMPFRTMFCFRMHSGYAERRLEPGVLDFTFGDPHELQVPAYVELRHDKLPRNASGKLLKNVLRGEGEVSFAETM